MPLPQPQTVFLVDEFRKNFPFYKYNPDFIYFDSTATTLKPQTLLDATYHFYQSAGSVHRSQHDESNTHQFENARQQVASFLNLEQAEQIVWTSGATQAINLVAQGLAYQLQENDEILVSNAEHHANFITWQQLANRYGAKLVVVPFDDNKEVTPAALRPLLSPRTKIVALNWVSNVTGVIQPIKSLIQTIRTETNALILLDGSQAVSHFKIDFNALDCDFLTFSAHKLYGPTGLGVLAGKTVALAQLQPTIFGGKMAEKVTAKETTFAPLPYALEAGTPNIAGVIGFGAVLNWLKNYSLAQMENYALALGQYLFDALHKNVKIKLFSPRPTPDSVVSTLSFCVAGINDTDLSLLLSEQNIAIRTGQHCAQPYLRALNTPSTLRVSLAPYNTTQDVTNFLQALDEAIELLCE